MSNPIADLIEEISAKYPFTVLVLRRRGNVYEYSKNAMDQARIRNVEGADYFELKKRRKGKERVLLKAQDFKNIYPRDFICVFEMSDGNYAPGKVEMLRRTVNEVRNEKGELISAEEVLEPFLVPDIDANADVVHVDRVNRLNKRYHLPSFWDRWGMVIMFVALMVGAIGLMWVLSTPVTAGFQARTTEALVLNETLHLNATQLARLGLAVGAG